MRYGWLLLVLLLNLGCATKNGVTYKVVSDPPDAQVDVNGVTAGRTPAEITLECARQWVGLANAPGGLANISGTYEIAVFPPKNHKGQSQTKKVDPCQWVGDGPPTLAFDLGLRSVSPAQQIEIITNDQKNEDGYGQAIKSLKVLREQGLISEAEYREKILKLTE